MSRPSLLLLCVLVLACSGKQKASSEGESQMTEKRSQPEEAVQEAQVADAMPAEQSWKSRLGQVDAIVYHFQDASVPPPDHRSYTIRVTTSTVEKRVDSYGDLISEQANAITAEQFKGLVARIDELGIGAGPSDADSPPGCSGGTSDSLSLYIGEEKLLSASADNCGGSRVGTLLGDVKQLVREAQALLESKLQPSPK